MTKLCTFTYLASEKLKLVSGIPLVVTKFLKELDELQVMYRRGAQILLNIDC